MNAWVQLFEGFKTNCWLFAVTLLLSLPLGLIMTMFTMSKFKPLQWFMKVFVWIIRGTPLMLQLIVFGLGPGLLGIRGMNMFVAVIIAFVLNYACYFAEIYRGGIQSVPVGQEEAGLVLGVWGTTAVIGIITCALSVGAVYIGKAMGMKLADKAEILGGVVLLAIGIKILLG